MTNSQEAPLKNWPPVRRGNGKNWSQAKLTILKLLWPLKWVSGKEIFRVINQTYYDRRILELRESGWQIETHSSGQMYRLLSHDKLPGQERQYPNAELKRLVQNRDQNTCMICGQQDANIQYDHKIPFERNGPTTIENLQLLCRACNVEKRGACKHCALVSCEGCPYAYPDLFADKLIVFLDKTTTENLLNKSNQNGVSKSHIASEIISSYFSTPENN